ncbi:MAG: hypothetical protein JWP87_5438 [Labilithrix sp.]|nr:hypothetical protein [Labilithrix sp.]
MNRLLPLVLVLASLSSCVPASEELPPAGAFGFVTDPSPAARGEPIVTSDGWTIRIETLALNVGVMATPSDMSSGRYYGSSEAFRIDASQSVQVFTRSLPLGPASGSISLTNNYLYEGSSRRSNSNAEVVGLSPEVNARFEVRADASTYPPSTYSPGNGPSVLLIARAERAGRVLQIDLSLDVYASTSGPSASGDVLANTLTAAPVHVVAEALFTDVLSRVLLFDDLAAADLDHDGRLTGQELAAGRVVCGDCSDVRPTTQTLFDTFRERCGGLLVP